MNILEGKVKKSVGNTYYVYLDGNRVIECNLKGNFKIKGIKSTNPLAVGDNVKVQYDETHNKGLILELLDRKNYIKRRSTKLSKKVHIISSNVDQALIISSIVYPQTPLGFIDRCLLICEAYNVVSVIIFNKVDLCRDKEKEHLHKLIDIYSNMGYKCIVSSTINGEGIEEIKSLINGKITLLMGQSGAGKSSIINKIEPSLRLKTAEVSKYNDKGTHTTSFAEMHLIENNSYVIDTPGIRSFGMVDDIEIYEVSHFFRDMKKFLYGCKYSNCLHINEPGCNVIKAVEEGEISLSRYVSYMSIIEEIKTSEPDYEKD